MTSRSLSSEKYLSIYLSVFAVIISIFPMLAIYFFVSHSATATLTDTLSEELVKKAMLVGQGIDRFYNERISDVKILSQADVLEGNNLPSINQYLAEIIRETPNLVNVEVTSLEGVVIAHSSDPDDVGRTIHDAYPAFQQSLTQIYQASQGDVFVSGLIDLDTGVKGVVLATPITDDSNTKVIKLLIAETNLEIIKTLLSELQESVKTDHKGVYIVDNDGRVITSTDPGIGVLDPFPDLNTNPDILRMFADRGADGSTIYIDRSGHEVIAGYSDMDEFGVNEALDWNIIAIAPLDSVVQSANILNKNLVVVAGIIGLIIFICMYALSRKVMRFIWDQANYDPLTNLPNRRLFIDRLSHSIKISKRKRLPTALCYIDLDNFKAINDTLGHHMGDELLLMAAKRITESVRDADTVARIGGDEFALILTEISDLQNIEHIVENIIKKLGRPFVLIKQNFYISASLGITVYPDDGVDPYTLLKNADQAMYRSKKQGKNCFSYFTEDMQVAAKRRLYMSNELRSALSNGHLQLYYQPIVSTTTYDMTKVEALLRWKHPDHGMISPAEFIAIAEESNLIHEIGEWVFHEATTQANKWRKIYDPDFQISINTSPKQFKSTVLCNNWLNYLETINLPGKNVIIEITESLLMTSETKITDQLLKLRDAGVQIAIDDFGTGYSSLSYLDKFDIDYLKIDKSFIDGIKADSSDYVLSEAIIVMAHKLGLEVIAEGVETDTQRKLLANINCDYNQGYLFSKPLPASEFESLLLQNRPAASQIIG